MAKHLTIGQVSQRSGVAVSALRYYEQLGLLTSERDTRGRRVYPPEVLRRISFITVGSSLGMSLSEVGAELARLPSRRTPTKRDWERVAAGWARRLDARMATLAAMRELLTSCIGCGCLSLRDCSLANRRDRAAKHGAGPRYLLGDAPE